MKLQYLGDSKDAFKWDLLHHLSVSLEVTQPVWALMLTPDDGSNEGSTDPSRFPGGVGVQAFCRALQANRSLASLRQLPDHLGGQYDPVIVDEAVPFGAGREAYFAAVAQARPQLVFFDPDNGFEPNQATLKHLRYAELAQVLSAREEAVAVVFQHHRRVRFEVDLERIAARIRNHLPQCQVQGLAWQSLMLVVCAPRQGAQRVGRACATYPPVRSRDVAVLGL
jgi:hypothetical protein